jgi:hypothetical protein
MKPEFSGIERRLDELNERLARLEALKGKLRSEFDADPYLRDIVERNLEVAAREMQLGLVFHWGGSSPAPRGTGERNCF